MSSSGPRGSGVKSGSHAPRKICAPVAWRSQNSRSSAVLPTPASPLRSTSAPHPSLSTRASDSASTASSCSRSSSPFPAITLVAKTAPAVDYREAHRAPPLPRRQAPDDCWRGVGSHLFLAERFVATTREPRLGDVLPRCICGRVRSQGRKERASRQRVEQGLRSRRDGRRPRDVTKERNLSEVVTGRCRRLLAAGVDVELAFGDEIELVSDLTSPDHTLARCDGDRRETGGKTFLRGQWEWLEHANLADQIELLAGGCSTIDLDKSPVGRQRQQREDQTDRRESRVRAERVDDRRSC